ncbi:MAG: nuclear transport factor 2 family protein [Bdellovibrionaceae bacterium]|nr:nuclear transport factor 2 family protein [Pseudobdellovibrionaceae bacterium]MBX3033925.1 nuclear transport factor 2 family protein [Pseudobdellovibrionaceae bacterium]
MAERDENPGERLVRVFNSLAPGQMDVLDKLYSPIIEFRDPRHEFHNLKDLKEFLHNQYQHVQSCHFEPSKFVHAGFTTVVEWTMALKHRYLNLGQEITLKGVSVVTEDPISRLIIEHRDYFDVSALVLKSIPGMDFLKKSFRKLEEFEKSFSSRTKS